MSDRLDAARHFVDSWDDPEMRRFAEEYAAEQAIDFARLAVDQAEQIARLQKAVREILPEYNRLDMEEQRMEEPHETPIPITLEIIGLTAADMEEQ